MQTKQSIKNKYASDLATIRGAMECATYESRQGLGERHFQDYHLDAVMKAITPDLLDIFEDIYDEGYEDGGSGL